MASRAERKQATFDSPEDQARFAGAPYRRRRRRLDLLEWSEISMATGRVNRLEEFSECVTGNGLIEQFWAKFGHFDADRLLALNIENQ